MNDKNILMLSLPNRADIYGAFYKPGPISIGN